MKALIFDTETTGLISNTMVAIDKQPEVIEFYGALVDIDKRGRYRISSELDILIRPKAKISEEITKITTINDGMVHGSPFYPAVHNMIKSLIEKAPLVIAHNMSFDREMIDIETKRIGKSIKWPMCLCTVEQTIHLKGRRMKLSELHEYLFKEKFEGAHRAKVDVQALIRCVAELHKREII